MAFLDKYGKPTDDVQCAGDFDHDAHMQKVNDYIEKMTSQEIETVIRDSENISAYVVGLHMANANKSKRHANSSFEDWQKYLFIHIDAELIAYAERNI